jgi:hypothetical protein
MPNRDLKSTANNSLSFERLRDKPIDHATWTNWGEVFVFVYSTDSMESYLDSYALLKQWIAYKANRVIQPVGYEEVSTAAVTMKLPVLWIGTKSDSSMRGAPAFEQIEKTARSLPLKWAEVSAKNGDNVEQVRDWIYEVWDVLKARERSIHIHCTSQLSNMLSTKHCKGGTLIINMDTLGRCIRHGTLLKVTKRGFKQETPCFLFEKALLFCKVANKGTFSVKKAIYLNLAVLTDSTRPAGDYAFELHAFGRESSNSSSKSSLKDSAGAASNSWQLLALGQADKDMWMDALTFAINHFSRDPERAKHYSSIKGLAVSSRTIQRQNRRQIGLPWSLLSTNPSSGIPIVVDSITSMLNNPSINTWGAFFLPGNPTEHKVLSERINRMDLEHLRSNTFLPMPTGSGSSSSPNLASSGATNSPRDTIIGAGSPLNSSGLLLSSSPTSSLVGQTVVNASTGTTQHSEKTVDLSGITALTAAEFLLSFLNASPTFVPVGFFTFLLQSCTDINMNSATGSQHLKSAFAMLPVPIFKTLARLMFVIQQSVNNTADDTVILKVARYMVPILVKDAAEFESLNHTKLLDIVQSLIREADLIFSMPTEGPSSAANSSSSTANGRTGNGSLGQNDALSTFQPSSFTMFSFGSASSANGALSGSTTTVADQTIESDFFSLATGTSSLQRIHGGALLASTSSSTPSLLSEGVNQQSSLLQGMSDLSSGLNLVSTGSAAVATTRRYGCFWSLNRVLPAVTLAGIGSLNTDQVMSRVARARASMAELLDSLKAVESVITVPEIEAVLQMLVITCNNLSRYKWEKYLEVIETDILDELCHLIEGFYRTLKQKGTTIEKALKSKTTRAVLISQVNDLSSLMNQFSAYIVNLQGHDQAKPIGERPKPRSGTGGPPGSSGSGSSGSLGSTGIAHGGFNGINRDAYGSGDDYPMSPQGSSELFQLEDLGDLSQVSAKQWWNMVFGSHSLRAPTEKVVAELLAVSRSSVLPGHYASTGISANSMSSSAGGSGTQSPLMSPAGEEGSGSQPATPRGGPVDPSNGTSNTVGAFGTTGSGNQGQTGAPKAEYPLLELSELEKKALHQLLDHQQTGFVNLLKFSQFMKSFGAIPHCVENAIQLIRSPYYHGYLNELEVVRLLELEEPGTYLLCFEGNDPSHWALHWIDAAQTHKSVQIVASPGEYVLRATKTARTGFNGSSSSPSLAPLSNAGNNALGVSSSPGGAAPASPRSPPTLEGSPLNSPEHTPRGTGDSLSSSGTMSTAQTLDASGTATETPTLHSSTPSPAVPALSIEGGQLGDAATNEGALSTPKIAITPDERSDVYPSIQAAIDSHPHDWQQPLKTNLYSLPFFYGDISESEGMRALKNQPVGTYLMIFSATKPCIIDCLYVSNEERIQHIIFKRTGYNARNSYETATTSSSPEDSSSMGFSASESASSTMYLLSSDKDGVAVTTETGEAYRNLKDAIKAFPGELKMPFTQKKSSGHVAMGSVHEGSLEKLVAYLYDDVVDLAYITVFLLTYRSFTQPPVLLEALMTQYRYLDSLQNGRPYQMRLVNFFKIWLSDFNWDLANNQDTLANILSFVNSDISLRFPSIAKQLQSYAGKVPIPTEKPDIVVQSAVVSPVPSSATYDEPSKVLDYPPDSLAQQMFSFEFELFSKIMPYELMGNGWMKADKHIRAPNIVRMVARSNLIGSWVVAEILKESNIKKRASLVEHFICVTDECYRQNNFHSAMVVMSALHDSSVQRLKLTWDKVSRKFKEMLESIETKMNDEDNFSAYRTAYVQAPPPKLPYMGLVFRDLIHIEDGSPKHLPSGAINFHRCELIAEKLQMIKMSQQDRLIWPKNEDLWHYIQLFPKHPDPQSQYHRSLELEPRAGGPSQGGSGTGGPSSPISNRDTTVSANDSTSSSSSKRQSRVMVYTASSGTTNGVASPASSSPSPEPASVSNTGSPNSSSDNLLPPRSVSPNPIADSSSQPASPDSGKWATPKKNNSKGQSKASGLTAMVGFMRKK